MVTNRTQRVLATITALAMVLAFVLAACSNTPAVESGPTPTVGKCNSALLPGRLLVEENGDNAIHALTCTQGTVMDKALVTLDAGAYSPADVSLSPDGRFVRYDDGYTNSPTFFLKNLQTGDKQTFNYPCVSFSPSSTQISYVTNKINQFGDGALIVKNLNTGAQRVLVQEPRADYLGLGPQFGDIDCGTWMSDTILLFHRFIGGMPATITTGSNLVCINDDHPIHCALPELAANTTTLANLRNGAFVDTRGTSLQVGDVSQDGSYVLFGDTAAQSQSLAKVSDLTSFAALHPITCANCYLRFVPNSDEVFGDQYDPSSERYKGLVFVDPQNLTVKYGPPGQPAHVWSNDPGSVIKWDGTPDHALVVYGYLDGDQAYLAVSDLQSGEINWLTKEATDVSWDSISKFYRATYLLFFLGWIP